MEHVDLPGLADFLAVARYKGLNVASHATGVPRATISRRVGGLELSLGVRLLERGSRKLRLTEDGQALVDRTGPLLAAVVHIADEICGRGDEPRGLLRVSVPSLFAGTRAGSITARYLERHPHVTLDMDVSDRHVDLIRENVDVVIRINPEPDSGLVGRRLLRTEMVLAAHPRIAVPASSSAMVDCIVLASAGALDEWMVLSEMGERRIRTRPLMRSSSMMVVHEAALAGAGAALMPHWLIKEDLAAGRLVSLGIVPNRQIEAWALHTSMRLTSPKVRTFVEMLVAEYQN